jgi:hypothetical protein
MPEIMPDRMPDSMPENMSDRMPEDLPVRKCINVMVGITRSKVICFFFRIDLAFFVAFILHWFSNLPWISLSLYGFPYFLHCQSHLFAFSQLFSLWFCVFFVLGIFVSIVFFWCNFENTGLQEFAGHNPKCCQFHAGETSKRQTWCRYYAGAKSRFHHDAISIPIRGPNCKMLQIPRK